MLPTPIFLPGEFHGQRSVGGYSPRGLRELDVTEQLMCSAAIVTAATPYGEHQGSSRCEIKGYWPPGRAEIHKKGMISVTPGSCIFPYTESAKFLNLGYLVFLN